MRLLLDCARWSHGYYWPLLGCHTLPIQRYMKFSHVSSPLRRNWESDSSPNTGFLTRHDIWCVHPFNRARQTHSCCTTPDLMPVITLLFHLGIFCVAFPAIWDSSERLVILFVESRSWQQETLLLTPSFRINSRCFMWVEGRTFNCQMISLLMNEKSFWFLFYVMKSLHKNVTQLYTEPDTFLNKT